MYEKPCRLARAAKYYKGGGGGEIDVPSFGEVLQGVTGGFPSVARTYRNFTEGEPYFQMQNPILEQLSQMAPGLANTFTGQPQQLLSDAAGLREQFANVPGEMLQGANQFAQQFQNLPAGMLRGANRLQEEFRGLPHQLHLDAQGIRRQFRELPGQYLDVLNRVLPIAQTGELTLDQRNQATQQARAAAQARGDIASNPAIFAEAMNRRQYADARQNQAIGQALQLGQGALGTALGRDQGAAAIDQMAQQMGISREQAAAQLQALAQGTALQREQGQAGLQQGALNLAAGRDAAAMGLTQGAQGVATGMEQLLGYPSQMLTQAELGQTGAFGNLINPMYGLAGQQLQAQTAGQVAAQGSSDQGKSNTMNSIIGIVGAAATAY